MINTCEGEHFSCGETAEWLIGDHTTLGLRQNRDNKVSFLLGETEIVVLRQIRKFRIDVTNNWDLQDPFLMKNTENKLFVCSARTSTSSNSVSEDYTCLTTKIHFIDTRHNNGLFTEYNEAVTFDYSGNEMAGFKQVWGTGWYHKMPVTNHKVTRIVTSYIVINGEKTVLKTETETRTPHTADNPLILVYPNPPSLAIPVANCDDIKQYGFYDYHEGGPAAAGGSKRIEQDGGDDFYWPEWLREVGELNYEVDGLARRNRYLAYYLGPSPNTTGSAACPAVFVDDTPCASIAVDPSGNMFYSATLGRKVFNSLSDGDLAELFPTLGSDPKFYPIAPV